MSPTLLRCLALAMAPLAALAQEPAETAAAKKPAQFWWATYPDFMVQYDPVSDQVVRKIQLQNGMPWGVTLAHDRQRFFVITDQQRKVEVVDRQAGAVTSVHEFVEDGYIIRVRSVMEMPGGTQWYVRTDRIKKLVDRYAFEPSQYLLYDTAEKKVVRKLRRLPEALRRGARISPDGSKWHVFTPEGDLAVLDPATLKEVAKVDLTTPLYSGMGRLQIGRQDLFDGQNPKKYRMLCTLSDRVQRNRTTWGYVDIDLETNKVSDLVEWGQGPSGFGTFVAKDAKLAVAGGGGGGSGDRRSRITLYDLETGKKLRETFEEFRPRQNLAGISPDGRKIYVGGAGSDFQVYDSETMQKIKTIELDGEINGQIFVLDG
jgi:hypothetical protein